MLMMAAVSVQEDSRGYGEGIKCRVDTLQISCNVNGFNYMIDNSSGIEDIQAPLIYIYNTNC